MCIYLLETGLLIGTSKLINLQVVEELPCLCHSYGHHEIWHVITLAFNSLFVSGCSNVVQFEFI